MWSEPGRKTRRDSKLQQELFLLRSQNAALTERLADSESHRGAAEQRLLRMMDPHEAKKTSIPLGRS
jgi:hypothetical protein